VAACLDHLNPTRLGHGVRAAEDPDVLARVVDSGVALEVCPTSNVSLGVYSTLDEVPVRQLLDAGADPGIRDPQGRSALDNAERLGFAEIAALIRAR
jgi:adenosine deaminase